MQGVLAVAAAMVLACGGQAVAPSPAPSSPATALSSPRPAELANVGFAVEARQLGDPDVVTRLRHRVRIKRWGQAYLAHDGTPFGRDDDDEDAELVDHILPVMDETDLRIQVVIEDDGARYGVWIEPRDAWSSIVAPVRLDATLAREPANVVGVFLSPGAPIEAGARRAGRRSVELRDEQLVAAGYVDARAIGRVYVVPANDPHPHHMTCCHSRTSWRRPDDARPLRELAGQTPIRARPAVAGATLAVPRTAREVAIVATRGAWTEIELVDEYVRVRGFVPRAALREPAGVSGFGMIGFGGGFGMSHADRIDVPAGTCLFSGVDGEIVGVQLETQTRLGRRRTERPEWSLVYVHTPWQAHGFYVHNTSGDPAKPTWEACTAP